VKKFAENTVTARLATAEPGPCMVTWQPDSLPDNLRHGIDVTITVTTPAASGPAGTSLRSAPLRSVRAWPAMSPPLAAAKPRVARRAEQRGQRGRALPTLRAVVGDSAQL